LKIKRQRLKKYSVLFSNVDIKSRTDSRTTDITTGHLVKPKSVQNFDLIWAFNSNNLSSPTLS